MGYHTKSVGMTYDRTLFGMKLADCRCLAQALTRCETLTQLCLAGNGLDDDKVRMLASGLTDNISITHLDLSHNKVGAEQCCLQSHWGLACQHAAGAAVSLAVVTCDMAGPGPGPDMLGLGMPDMAARLEWLPAGP